MNASLAGYLELAIAVSVESLAQVLMKIGSAKPSSVTAASASLPATRFGSARRETWILLAVAAYVVEILFYSLALRHLSLSVAFPCGSLCFVGVALLSRYFLGETVSRTRWVGIAFILGGVTLLAS